MNVKNLGVKPTSIDIFAIKTTYLVILLDAITSKNVESINRFASDTFISLSVS